MNKINKKVMKLTDEQFQLVVAHLQKVAPEGFGCPICGEKHWIINNVLFETREFANGTLFPKEPTVLIPFVTLDCPKCHNTLFLNAVALGIVSPNKKEDSTLDNNKTSNQSKEESHG